LNQSKPNPQRILKEWKQFADLIFDQRHGEIQREEMQKAFFAGASAMYYLLINNVSESNERTVEESDMQLMRDINEELMTFKEYMDFQARRQKVQ
jgi:hypothetical protein